MEHLQFILEDIHPFSRHYKHMLKFEQEEMQKANLENRPPREYSMTFLRKGVISVPVIWATTLLCTKFGQDPFNMGYHVTMYQVWPRSI